MPVVNFIKKLVAEVDELKTAGTAKGAESVVVAIKPARAKCGPRFLLEGQGEKEFLRMNSNSYLGLSLHRELIAAEEKTAQKFGVGPGAVRFISGTYTQHVQLEKALARFHGRPACMLTSSAYTSVVGVIASLATPETIIISDELNHSCIINGTKLARPKAKEVYAHLDMAGLEKHIQNAIGQSDNLLVITDGVFSMRGDLAPLAEISALIARYNDKFSRDILLMVDDSHGIGALGKAGRGTEQVTGAKADILVGTLGKAFGVNGGYIVADEQIIAYLRQKNPFYIYTNPITPAEAAAALRALQILQSAAGRARLRHLTKMTTRFEKGLIKLGFETISSPHPVVPLVVRDTQRTRELVNHLREHGVLATGLAYPVVPKGGDLIRFQVCADHTPEDIDYVLGVLKQRAATAA